jgi:serine/threonine protein kinase
LIISVRGTPDVGARKNITNEFALKYIESLPPKDKVPLGELFPGISAQPLDLLDKMLDLNPETRIRIEDALSHPFLESMHDEEDEPNFEGVLDFSFEEDSSLNIEKLKRLILK